MTGPFLRLTNPDDGKQVIVNAAHIARVEPRRYGAAVVFPQGDVLHVAEHPDTIVWMLTRGECSTIGNSQRPKLIRERRARRGSRFTFDAGRQVAHSDEREHELPCSNARCDGWVPKIGYAFLCARCSRVISAARAMQRAS